MSQVTINGSVLPVAEGATVLETAREHGIEIPTLCHHPLTGPYGGCRLCLVEVDGNPALQASCALPAHDGLVVTTTSERISKARRTTLELLLINHPLDCPVCDKAGECELQQLVLRYGPETGRFAEPKRTVPASFDDPIFARNMERCVSCTRCVRVCADVQGATAISMIGRGGTTRMEPFDPGRFGCEYCGNCLEACPVGAILGRPHLHAYRPWMVDAETRTICGHCGVGCSLVVQAREGRILRVVCDSEHGINSGLLCSRGRFGTGYIHSGERLSTPLVRRNGELQESSWNEAISEVAGRLAEIREEHGGAAIAGIASRRSTNEECYLFQKLIRTACGSNNIDSLARCGFGAAQDLLEHLLGAGATNAEMSEITGSDTILVAGGDPSVMSPILGVWVRRAAMHGARVAVLGRAPGLERFATVHAVPRALAEAAALEAMLAKVVSSLGRASGRPELERAIAALGIDEADDAGTEDLDRLVELLVEGESTSIVVGPELVRRSDGHRALIALAGLTDLLEARLYLLSEGANDQGLRDMGCAPHLLPGGIPVDVRELEPSDGLPSEPGLGLMEIFDAAEAGELRALYVVGENPAFNLPDSPRMRRALSGLDLLVVQDIFLTETARLADVVLPAQAWGERTGTQTNLEGRIQLLRQAVEPGAGRADWEILRDVGAQMGQTMPYSRPEEIWQEMARIAPAYRGLTYRRIARGDCLRQPPDIRPPSRLRLDRLPPRRRFERGGRLFLECEPLLFHPGSTTRRDEVLSTISEPPTAAMSPFLAGVLGLEEGDTVRLRTALGTLTLPVRIDESAPEDRVLLSNIFAGAGAYELMGSSLDPVTLAPGTEGCEVAVERVREVVR